jgi:serine/threonine-protein kinase
VWRSRAAALLGRDDSFYDDAAELGREQLGDVSPFHAEAGVHAAAAMIAAAMGDEIAQPKAIEAFLDASRKPCSEVDLALGRSGSLLAAALLLAASPDAAALRAFGAETMRAIWSELDALPPLAACPGATLGMAHGWTGYLYATLRWHAASGEALPPRFAARLGELAALSVAEGRGICWPFTAGEAPRSDALGASWCNGTAGQLFLFTALHRIAGGDEWLRLAELCAWSTWDAPRASSDLCCGTAGRAYALLNFYKHTGRAGWLGRARQLANDAAAAAATASRPNALWRGELGVAVLVADLASPENARMPFFE